MRFSFNFLFWCCIYYVIDILAESFGLSRWGGIWFSVLIVVTALMWTTVFTRLTENITVADKVKFRKFKIIKTTDGRTFINNNDLLIKWNSNELDKKLKNGHTYRVVSYSYFYGNRIILYAHEIKSSARKKIRKKQK